MTTFEETGRCRTCQAFGHFDCAAPRRFRAFAFDRETNYQTALRIVRAALDDEGLALSDANTRGDQPLGVLTSDALTVYVPGSRIVSREWPRGAAGQETR